MQSREVAVVEEEEVGASAVDDWALALFRLRDTDWSGITERSTFTMHFVPRVAIDSKRVWTWLADPLSRPENVDIIHQGRSQCGAGGIECMMIGFSIPRGLPPQSTEREAEKKRYQSLIDSFGPVALLKSEEIGFGARRSHELFRADARPIWGSGTYEIVTQGEGFHTRLLALAESQAMGAPKKKGVGNEAARRLSKKL